MDFPTVKNEEYKFTNVRSIAQTSYQKAEKSSLTKTQIEGAFIPNLEGNVLVFVNGIFSKENSTIVTDASKLTIQPLEQAIEENSTLFQEHYSKEIDFSKDAFNALNTAYAQNGVFISVPKGKIVEEKHSCAYILFNGHSFNSKRLWPLR